MTGTRLHRPLFARLFGTVLAGILTICSLIGLGLLVLVLIAALTDKSANGVSWSLIPAALFVALWARVVTAWTSFDDDGVHTRFLARFDYPWAEMHSVTLQRLGVVASARTPGPPAIVVRMSKPAGREDKLSPVLRCGRHRREFATALLAAAHAHGVRTVVGSNGWDEAQQESVDFYEG